jgi:hypothetical protein
MTKQMMMMIKKTALLILLLSLAGIAFSQDNDFGLWFEVDASHELVNKLDAEFFGALRTFNNSTQIQESFLEGGLHYNVNKYVSLSGSYRLTSRIEDDSKYYFRHKYFMDIKGTLPVRKFSFSLRAKIQSTTKTYIEEEDDLLSKYYFRLKFKGTYDLSAIPLKPYVYYESFIPVFSDSGYSIDRYRISAGAELQISRKSSVDLGYIFQRDYQPHLSDENIVSINYKIKF